VSYINTYADVKAESDIICTSGNAVRVVQSLNSDRVIFLPDQFLAANVARESGKQILFPKPNENVDGSNVMIGWRGACEVHERFTVQDITNIRSQFPGVAVLAHPECPPDVVDSSDYSQSTSRMVEFVKNSDAPHFLLLTECSMADNIIAENPTKDVLRLCSIRCPHMNEITLEDTLNALRNNEQEIHVPEEIASRARVALERMLAV
jgi:quinolinate synthase